MNKQNQDKVEKIDRYATDEEFKQVMELVLEEYKDMFQRLADK